MKRKNEIKKRISNIKDTIVEEKIQNEEAALGPE